MTLAALVGTSLIAGAQQEEKGPRGKGGPKLPAEVIAKFDTDGDGKLTGDERKAAMEAGKEKMKERRAAMLAKFDTDGDGELSKEEREAARAAFVAKYDTDGDGKLSKEEREAVPADERPMGARGGQGAKGPKGAKGKGKGKGKGPKGGSDDEAAE